MAKTTINKTTFHREIYSNLKKKLVKCCIWSIAFVVVKTGHCGKYIRNTWKVLKFGAGEAGYRCCMYRWREK